METVITEPEKLALYLDALNDALNHQSLKHYYYLDTETLRERLQKPERRAEIFSDALATGESPKSEAFHHALSALILKQARNMIAKRSITAAKHWVDLHDTLHDKLEKLAIIAPHGCQLLAPKFRDGWRDDGVSITTSRSQSSFNESDHLVVTHHAPEIAVLFEKLRRIFRPILDFHTKPIFFSRLAKTVESAVRSTDELNLLRSTLISTVINEAHIFLKEWYNSQRNLEDKLSTHPELLGVTARRRIPADEFIEKHSNLTYGSSSYSPKMGCQLFIGARAVKGKEDWQELYLVNSTPSTLPLVQTNSIGFETVDDDVAVIEPTPQDYTNVLSGEAVKIMDYHPEIDGAYSWMIDVLIVDDNGKRELYRCGRGRDIRWTNTPLELYEPKITLAQPDTSSTQELR